ncbi:DUF707 domain-containing protein (plasmid) [Comamonadaceae bacterium OTU4NAUVB1]|jgi:hypothetical protein|nr:DUF707 domain-containing protein [Comamonadaceae bacterium OTU4NAUVB1]
MTATRPSATAQPSKRYLVIGRVGGKSLHRAWTEDTSCTRTWDLQLNAYGDTAAQIADADLPTVVDQGTKWDSLARHFRAHPELLERYDYVMLPDDDLLMDARGINRIFEMAVAHDLTIAQPAMSMDSFVSYPVLMQCPGFSLRYTNHLECMSPCIKTSYMKTLLPIIEKYVCGWGADHIWALLMAEPAYKAAVLDEVTMTHTRAFYTGTLYDSFAKQGVNPFDEVKVVTALFENFPKRTVVYGGISTSGRHVGSVETQLRNSAHLIATACRTKTPFKIFRKGVGQLLQAFTEATHRPSQLRLKSRATSLPQAVDTNVIDLAT